MKINIKDIKKAPYNPRRLGKDAKDALKNSLKTFRDISGIVINTRTGNVLAGNHRWTEIVSTYGGLDKLSFEEIYNEEYFAVLYQNKSESDWTGFIVRLVDWPIEKEKAANVTANNDLIRGEFTSDLQGVLASLEDDFSSDLFDSLRLDELQIDLDGIDEDLDWSEDQLDKISDPSERNQDDTEDSNIREIRSVIKISCNAELKDEVKSDILEFLAKKIYYNEITIV